MKYMSVWKCAETDRILNVDHFSELSDALEDVCSTLWSGNTPVLMTVTDENGEVIAERHMG